MIDIKLKVKPLSANAMYYNIGRHKKKSKAYEDYQEEIYNELKGIEWPFGTEQISFYIEAGLSARQADIDNTIKPLLDTLQGIFEDFNDNKVYYIEAHKTIVAKGSEYLWIRVRPYDAGAIRDGERELEGQTVPEEEQESATA